MSTPCIHNPDCNAHEPVEQIKSKLSEVYFETIECSKLSIVNKAQELCSWQLLVFEHSIYTFV